MQFENGLNAIRERAPAATTGKKFLPQNFYFHSDSGGCYSQTGKIAWRSGGIVKS